MRTVLAQLRDYWFAETITPQDKKELLRCLVEQVVVDGRGDMIQIRLHWYGGSSSQLAVPKRLQSSADLYFRIQELAQHQTDSTIAAQLQADGYQTAYKRHWTARHVLTFRRFHHMLSAFDSNPVYRLSTTSYITGAEAVAQLGVKQDSIHEWCQLGILTAYQDGSNKPFWIHWNEDVSYRLCGDATPLPTMVAVRSLCTMRGETRQQIFAWALAHELPIYRLRRGSQKPFYILLSDPSDPHM